MTESKLRQETMNFNQNLFILVEQFNNQQAQLQIADDADKIAQKRYSTNVETFMVGKISTLDLNDPRQRKMRLVRSISMSCSIIGTIITSCAA